MGLEFCISVHVEGSDYRTVFQNKNDTRCPKKNKAVALLKQQATAFFLLGHPVANIFFLLMFVIVLKRTFHDLLNFSLSRASIYLKKTVSWDSFTQIEKNYKPIQQSLK